MKIFRDSVHGYIRIPAKWCSLFIDTPVFQRLRHIEQTSMRCLYPSARHDRFIHSLGTYHLGKMAFANVEGNASQLVADLGLGTDELRRYRETFLLACLMHDCAHAPFSHTFEEYYDLGGILDNELLGLFAGPGEFPYDLECCDAAPHEKASAIILLRKFASTIESETEADPKLAARMIIGCTHHHCQDDRRKKFENSLIMLLNGNAIDVDKLDYIMRDTWASGVNNVTVDVSRLLSSLTISEMGAKTVPAFRKQALSVVQGVVDARNYLYRWIYSHHKVQYDQFLLKTAVHELARILADADGTDCTDRTDRDRALLGIFSLDTFSQPVLVGEHPFSMVTDGDLVYLLKAYENRIPAAQEWLSRQHSRRPVWKTRAEFDLLLDEESRDELNSMMRQLRESMPSSLSGYLYQEIRVKELSLNRGNLFIEIGGKTLSFPELFRKRSGGGQHDAEMPFFILYQPRDDDRVPEEVRDCLRSLL